MFYQLQRKGGSLGSGARGLRDSGNDHFGKGEAEDNPNNKGDWPIR